MATTLTYLATPLSLSEHLLWVDEAQWQPVQQRTQFTITGALVVQAGAKQAGRPITLAGGPTHGWMTRAVVDQLLAWQAIAGAEFTLLYRGVTRTVVFDHERTAVQADPLLDYHTPAAGDFYVVTLRFLEL